MRLRNNSGFSQYEEELDSEMTGDSETTSDSDGPYVKAYREAPPRGSLRLRGARVAQWFLWLCGVGSFAWLFFGYPMPYLLCTAAAINMPLPAPLGQVPPLPDQLLLVYVWGLRCPLLVGSIGMAARSWRSHPVPQRSDLDQLWWSGIAAFLLLAVCRGGSNSATVAQAFADNIDCSSSPPPPRRPRRPLLGWVHPYFYRCFDRPPGVKIRRVTEHLTSFVDVWEKEVESNGNGATPGEPSREAKPIFFYVHGGGWKGGNARMTPHAPLLQALAVGGWYVVSCEYRKGAWPEHMDDCMEALRFVLREQAVESRGPGAVTITLAGASAGGHLASLMALRALREGLCSIESLLLFYPVLDPQDVARATARSPLPLPMIRLGFQQSFLAWFIERAVLRNRRELWNEADPLWNLDQLLASQEFSPQAVRLPRTLIVHGACDSVVPIEHSRRWIAALEARDPSRHKLVAVPFARHTYDIVASCTVEAVFDGTVAWLSEGARPQPHRGGYVGLWERAS